MATTLTRILLHIIFSTKNREPLIPADRTVDLYAYIGGICRNHGCVLEAAGGMPDHVHLLVSLSKTIALADLMKVLKRDSTRWIKDGRSDLKRFYWQEGYAALSIGQSQVATLRRYLANQAKHHQTRTFQEELIEFLDRYGVEYDPSYVLD